MQKVHSRDGTSIAFDTYGEGPAVVLVDGALCYRDSGPSAPLAKMLAPNFTVYTYDRRGRGDSGDTAPWSTEREVEDLDAIIRAAGGSAYVYGISSGAALALEAANSGLPIKKLVLYEAPFIVDDSRAPIANDFLPRLKQMVADDRRGDAVKAFMKLVGVPSFGIAIMRLLPVWKKLKAVAHTLPYDIGLLAGTQNGKPLSPRRWSAATVPTLVADGGKSPAWIRNGMRTLSLVLPNATYHTVEGQTHMLSAKAITPVLEEYFR